MCRANFSKPSSRHPPAPPLHRGEALLALLSFLLHVLLGLFVIVINLFRPPDGLPDSSAAAPTGHKAPQNKEHCEHHRQYAYSLPVHTSPLGLKYNILNLGGYNLKDRFTPQILFTYGLMSQGFPRLLLHSRAQKNRGLMRPRLMHSYPTVRKTHRICGRYMPIIL